MPPSPKTFKHLLVDLDGTLLGAKDLRLNAHFLFNTLKTLVPQIGFFKTWQLIQTVKNQLRYPETFEVNNATRVQQAVSRLLHLSLPETDAFLSETIQAVFLPLKDYFFPIPGAKEFLEWAKQHYPLTLATNPVWTLDYILLRLKWAEIEPEIFTLITDATQMVACKPRREYYENILQRHQLQAKDVLLIGNDPTRDLPATQFGIAVYLIHLSTPFREIEPLKSGTSAWTGNYADLRRFLETSSTPSLSG